MGSDDLHSVAERIRLGFIGSCGGGFGCFFTGLCELDFVSFVHPIFFLL